MAEPATPEPADAWDSECSDDDAGEREYFAGRYLDGGGVWLARLALDPRGRPDVELHPQLCDCDVLLLEILGGGGAAARRGRGRELVVERRVTGVTRSMREQLVQLELLAATPERLTLAIDSREFGGLDDYDAIHKMSDPVKLEINRLFARAVSRAMRSSRARNDGINDRSFGGRHRSAVVLDAPTMVSTRTLLQWKGLDDLRVTAVSNTTSRAEWWINQTAHRARARVALVRSDIESFLWLAQDEHDAIFLDHCGCITTELGALPAALYALRETGGVLAATYCVRRVGHDRTVEMFEAAMREGPFQSFEWVCPPKRYGMGMVFFMVSL